MKTHPYFENNHDYIQWYNTYREYYITQGYNYISLENENIFVYEGSMLMLAEDYVGRLAVVNASATEESDFYFDWNSDWNLTNLNPNFDYKFLVQVEYITGKYAPF